MPLCKWVGVHGYKLRIRPVVTLNVYEPCMAAMYDARKKGIGVLRSELVRDMTCLAWYDSCLRPMHQTLTHPVLDRNQFGETYCCDTNQDQTCLTPLRLELNGSAYEIRF